jgi:hypothetical protein
MDIAVVGCGVRITRDGDGRPCSTCCATARADRLQGRLRHRRLRRLLGAARRPPRLLLPRAGSRGQGQAHRDHRGHGDGEELHPLQRKFLEHAALQCGICTPGFLVAAKALLDRTRTRPKKRCATGSPATCAAARATTRSSAPCWTPPRKCGGRVMAKDDSKQAFKLVGTRPFGPTASTRSPAARASAPISTARACCSARPAQPACPCGSCPSTPRRPRPRRREGGGDRADFPHPASLTGEDWNLQVRYNAWPARRRSTTATPSPPSPRPRTLIAKGRSEADRGRVRGAAARR